MKFMDLLNEEITPLTPKDRKKARLIYNLYKKGKFKFDDMPDSFTYYYELPDEWVLTGNENGTLHIRCKGSLELYVIIEQYEGPSKKPVDKINYFIYRDGKQKVMNRFRRYNIYLYVE